MTALKAGDIVFTRSKHWLGRIIRWFERSKGEEESQANHVGIVVTPGNETSALIVEALWSVKCHTLEDQYGGKDELVCIYRPINLTDDDLKIIVRSAKSYVGKPYGPLKLLLHAADRLLGGVTLFRHFAVLDQFPVCSYVVAKSYAEAGYYFGVDAQAADPDDIWDFCVSRRDRFELVRRWSKVAPLD